MISFCSVTIITYQTVAKLKHGIWDNKYKCVSRSLSIINSVLSVLRVVFSQMLGIKWSYNSVSIVPDKFKN